MKRHFKVNRGRFILAMAIFWLWAAGIPPSAMAQDEAQNGAQKAAQDEAREESSMEDAIFNRFTTSVEEDKSRQALFLVPVFLRPQTDPDAKVIVNKGLSYQRDFNPLDRVFTSLSFHYYRSEWEPSAPGLQKVQVYQLEIVPMLTFNLAKVLGVGFGVGLGLMDGLVEYPDGSYTRREGLYMPIRLGVSLNIANTASLAFVLAHTPYWSEGSMLSSTRAQFGLGYYY